MFAWKLTISLAQLRKLAAGLDCELVYGSGANLVAAGGARREYLAALRAADAGDIASLTVFVRS